LTNLKQKDLIEKNLVKKLIELFEIIVILCVGKLQGHVDVVLEVSKKNQIALERHISTVDEYSAEVLIK